LSKPKEEKKEGGLVKSRAYHLTVEEATEKPYVVSGTFLQNAMHARVIFDFGATYSHVSMTFATNLKSELTPLTESIVVEVIRDTPVLVRERFQGYYINNKGRKFPISLYPTPTREFNIIVRMGWLPAYNAKVVYKKKVVEIEALDGSQIIVRGERNFQSIPVVSMAKARATFLMRVNRI